MSLLQVNDLSKSFAGQPVLRSVSFSLERGETLSVIGPSGGGKTTLLRCLNFLERPEGGRIAVGGETLLDAGAGVGLREAEIRRARRHFGLVFQSFLLFPQYTALENVCLAPLLQCGGDKAARASVREAGAALLRRVGLGDKLGLYPHQLSGGQQQRVAIARALALRPEVLFFDEPTSALDPELTGEVLRVIRQLSEEGMTMVIVTHEMDFAAAVSDGVLFLEGGRIVEQGPPEQVLAAPREERTRRFLRSFSA